MWMGKANSESDFRDCQTECSSRRHRNADNGNRRRSEFLLRQSPARGKGALNQRNGTILLSNRDSRQDFVDLVLPELGSIRSLQIECGSRVAGPLSHAGCDNVPTLRSDEA